MVKQLSNAKDGANLFLESPILELLGLRDDGLVTLTIDHGCLIVNPVNPKAVPNDQFQACLDRVMAEQHDLLKKLVD